MHRGVEATCMPGAYLAHSGERGRFRHGGLAAGVLRCWTRAGRRAPRYELASMTEGGCPPVTPGRRRAEALRAVAARGRRAGRRRTR